MKEGRIFSINYSNIKGVSKVPVKKALLIKDFGLDKDAHAGTELRQVSLLSIESIRRQKGCSKIEGKEFTLKAGDFAENITTEGIDLSVLKINDKIRLGHQVVLEISKIGKECHKYCSIYYKVGDCIMPREGIFAKVLVGGEIAVGDSIGRQENV